VTGPFHEFNRFDLVTLNLLFGLLVKKPNNAYIFNNVSTRTLIFHISVACDKTFLWLIIIFLDVTFIMEQ
jgi:hypothetical protein